MSKIEPVCSLSNLNKFKCYTQSGSKKVYEDDGLTKGQSFIIFPNKTTLSTGECEYTIGLTGKLDDQHPWKDWTYTPPSDAVVGTTYSYEMTGEPMTLSNYKGVLVTGIPSKKWTWDIESIKEIQLISGVGAWTNTGLLIFLQFFNNEYLENDRLNVNVEITANNPNAFIDSVTFIVSKNSTTPLTREISLKPNYNRVYSAKTVSCRPMGGKNYKVTIEN